MLDWLGPTPMTSVLLRRGETQAHRERPRDDRGRDRSGAAMNQRMQGLGWPPCWSSLGGSTLAASGEPTPGSRALGLQTVREEFLWPFKKFFYLFLYFLKVFIEFVTISLLFYVLVSWPQGTWDLVPRPGIEPVPPALEGEI